MTREHANAAITTLLLGVVAALLYAPVTDFPFVDWADDVRLLANPWVRSGLSSENFQTAFFSEWSANWSPLTWISHMLDFSLYGTDAGGHHRTNLLLHALNAALLFGALRTATGATWQPAAVAALFVLHPVNVESVAWVSERKGLLATSAGLASLWCYAAHARGGGPARKRLAVLFLALGLMAKPLLLALPILFLLLDYWPLNRLSAGEAGAGSPARRPLRQLVVEKWPYLALVSASVAMMFLPRPGGGVAGQLEALPLTARLANAVISYPRYLGKLLWPQNLAVYYPHPSLPGGAPWEAVEVGAAAALLALLAIAAWRIGNPAVRMGLAWFVLSLLPMIGIVQLGSHAIADRYLYLPAIGVFIAIVWGVSGVLRESSPQLRMVAAAIFVTVLVPLALMSRAQIEVWRRSETLFRHATRNTDANYNMHFHLASTLKQRGRIEEAIAEYKKAIAIHPGMVRAHYHLANTFTDEKQIDAAIEHMRIAANSRPSPAGARDALGRLMIQTGDISRALTHFRQEMALRPNSIEVRVTLALLLQTAGQLPEAIRAYEAAIALAPEDDRWSGAAAALRQQLEARNQEP